MTIAFDIPQNIESLLQQGGQSPSVAAKEAFLVELYRQEKISHGELAQALGLSRQETDVVLNQHGVTEDLLTPQELAAQVASLSELLRQ